MTRSRTTDDGPQINRALARLRATTRLPLTFGGLVSTDQRVRLTEFAGPITGALRGLALDPGCGLGGKAVALRRPLVVNDYVCSPKISHHYDNIIAEHLRAMVAVPLVVRGTARGVLYGSVRSAVPIGDRIIHSVVESARDLEQNLAVQDELARRLDWLDQQGATGSAAESATPLWERVREAYAELRILAKDVDDAFLRQRVEAACAKLSSVKQGAAQAEPTLVLTSRELDVLACVALGWTNADVASDLGIKVETVKSYLCSAMGKLMAHSRLEAVVAARRLGLLP
ncbi:LuxR C-terminal-related transcriptional regulator [Candidatus Protofrankia californiensis]|uniref:LuxR C-terminal-related transcriptional regulator n=1 Tax=Candidatus Protofrankia californiensis TaxID=1839754 RepID=UPI0019D0E23F|nr:LuxR C-terminal-related transcriptional regulator [Candidatus Protofrankia californiensis]